MNNAQGKKLKFWLGMVLLGCLAPLSAAWASTVNISSMLVNTASLTVSITGDGTYSFSGPVVPPAEILMGQYQDPIYTANVNTSGATGTATIYSTGAYSEPAPSGYVDTGNSNPVNVNFSSFRLNVNLSTSLGPISFDAPAWIVNPPNSSSTFDALTNAYTLGWSNSFTGSADINGVSTSISGNVQAALGGTLTPVPAPAALWLFGSGLIGIAVFACRSRSARRGQSAA